MYTDNINFAHSILGTIRLLIFYYPSNYLYLLVTNAVTTPRVDETKNYQIGSEECLRSLLEELF